MRMHTSFSGIVLIVFSILFHSCTSGPAPVVAPVDPETPSTSLPKGSYGYDVFFLKKNHKSVIELKNQDGNARVLLSADYQGRIMTSTASGDSGTSFGWLNYPLIAASEKRAAFNPVGGEERFWIGPEGGQFSIYFKKGDSFNIGHWQVPAVIDTLPYDAIEATPSKAVFSKSATLTNYSGTRFTLTIEREINLLSNGQIGEKLNLPIPAGVSVVGFSTTNKITNTGDNNWTKDKGLLSIWLLGMFTPSPKTSVIIPFHPVPAASSFITNNYFGEIPPGRLVIKDSVLYFKCDGKFRSKIGLSPFIAKPMAASFDFQNNVLTIILPGVQKNAPYVNSKWELQKEPFKGDVINAYNDGPLADGTQMGPFYEIESSSPALQLKKSETGEYQESTIHLQGEYGVLKQMALKILGVDLDSVPK